MILTTRSSKVFSKFSFVIADTFLNTTSFKSCSGLEFSSKKFHLLNKQFLHIEVTQPSGCLDYPWSSGSLSWRFSQSFLVELISPNLHNRASVLFSAPDAHRFICTALCCFECYEILLSHLYTKIEYLSNLALCRIT
jgi:hypothetical protein